MTPGQKLQIADVIRGEGGKNGGEKAPLILFPLSGNAALLFLNWLKCDISDWRTISKSHYRVTDLIGKNLLLT